MAAVRGGASSDGSLFDSSRYSRGSGSESGELDAGAAAALAPWTRRGAADRTALDYLAAAVGAALGAVLDGAAGEARGRGASLIGAGDLSRAAGAAGWRPRPAAEAGGAEFRTLAGAPRRPRRKRRRRSPDDGPAPKARRTLSPGADSFTGSASGSGAAPME